MPELICKDTFLRVSHVGCRQTRVTLLALELGSKVWLSFEGQPILFERSEDNNQFAGARGFVAVGNTAARWIDLCREHKGGLLEFDFIERPDDEGAAGTGYYQREIA